MHHLKLFKIMFFFFLFTLAYPFPSMSTELDYWNRRSLLSVERPNNIVVSPDHIFSVGFRSVGENAYRFAVWLTKAKDFTPVWIANRDQPVNGKVRGPTLEGRRYVLGPFKLVGPRGAPRPTLERE